MKRPYRTTGQITIKPDFEDEGPSYVECVFAIDYQVTPYRQDGQLLLEPEVLSVSLESAVAWIGDCGRKISDCNCLDACACKGFEINAVSRFEEWHNKLFMLNGKKWYPHRDQVTAKILEDYEDQQSKAEASWS